MPKMNNAGEFTPHESTLSRTISIDRADVDSEARTVSLAFSSEEPYRRWDGNEILDHGPNSVRLSRLRDGAPVLIGHDHADHVGVIESVSIDPDRVGRALVRFGRGARATEKYNDVLDGILTKVSVGYRVHKAVVEERNEQGEIDSYRVTDWEPFEVSLVSVPADNTVGVGRSDTAEDENPPITPIEIKTMPDTTEAQTPAVDTKAIAAEASTKAQTETLARVSELMQAGEEYSQFDGAAIARSCIEAGEGLNSFNVKMLERMGKSKPVQADAPDIGLNQQERQSYSMVRLIHALANPADRRAQEAAAFEFECSSAAADKLKREPHGNRETRGVIVPVDVLRQDVYQRDLNLGGSAANLVATDLLSGSFIDMLRNRAVVLSKATMLTDLSGNIAIPRMTGGAAAYWVAEGSAPTEGTPAFDQVTLSPETVGAYTEITRKTLLQSSIDIEALVRRDLATSLALELDRVAINGSGASNQPTGILNQTGIGAVVGGTNGLAPAWGHMVDLETAVAIDNADIGAMCYLSNAKVRGALKQTEKASGTAQFIMDSNAAGVNGYEMLTSNQVPGNLTKGTASAICSAIIFGNFADLIVGMWGGLDLMVNPYSLDTTGAVRVTAFQDADLAVRHPESFAAMVDALTS